MSTQYILNFQKKTFSLTQRKWIKYLTFSLWTLLSVSPAAGGAGVDHRYTKTHRISLGLFSVQRDAACVPKHVRLSSTFCLCVNGVCAQKVYLIINKSENKNS